MRYFGITYANKFYCVYTRSRHRRTYTCVCARAQWKRMFLSSIVLLPLLLLLLLACACMCDSIIMYSFLCGALHISYVRGANSSLKITRVQMLFLHSVCLNQQVEQTECSTALHEFHSFQSHLWDVCDWVKNANTISVFRSTCQNIVKQRALFHSFDAMCVCVCILFVFAFAFAFILISIKSQHALHHFFVYAI